MKTSPIIVSIVPYSKKIRAVKLFSDQYLNFSKYIRYNTVHTSTKISIPATTNKMYDVGYLILIGRIGMF